MAATVTINVFTGATPTDQGALVGGIDLCSDDNALYSAANRIANPLYPDSYSYEKWLAPEVTVDPDNWIGLFKVWGDGDVDTNTTLRYGTTASGAQPVNTASSIATIDFTLVVAGSKGWWDNSTKTPAQIALDAYFAFLVLQLYVSPSCVAGDWGPETIYYEYQEL